MDCHLKELDKPKLLYKKSQTIRLQTNFVSLRRLIRDVRRLAELGHVMDATSLTSFDGDAPSPLLFPKSPAILALN